MDGEKIEFNYNINSVASEEPVALEEAFTSDLPESAIEEFLIECEEIVERISRSLQAIEKKKQYDRNLVDGLYRDVLLKIT